MENFKFVTLGFDLESGWGNLKSSILIFPSKVQAAVYWIDYADLLLNESVGGGEVSSASLPLPLLIKAAQRAGLSASK